MELTWVRSLVDDLDTGRLTWNDEWLQTIAVQLGQVEPQNNQQED
jgi:hypothetical protein